jgi:membrane protein
MEENGIGGCSTPCIICGTMKFDFELSGKPKAIKDFLQAVLDAWGQTRGSRMSAALSYYAMFALAPMIFVAFKVVGVFVDELAAADEFFSQLATTVGPETAQFLQEVVVNVSQRTVTSNVLTSVIGFLALLNAASGLFTGLRDMLNTIWQAPPHPKGGIMVTIENRGLAFLLVIGVGLLLTLSMFASFVLSLVYQFLDLPGQTPIPESLMIVGLAWLSFCVLYKILPNVHVGWSDVWPGALLAALAFGLAAWLLGFYLARSDPGSAFGAASAMAVMLITINYFAQIFLFGAVFSRVYAYRFGSKVGSPFPPEPQDGKHESDKATTSPGAADEVTSTPKEQEGLVSA